MKKVILAVAVLAMACIMLACGKDTLAGSWNGTFEGMSATFTFNEDGTGKIEALGVLSLDMTYTADDSKLTITVGTVDAQETQEMSYKLDGDSLTIVDAEGSTAVLTRTE